MQRCVHSNVKCKCKGGWDVHIAVKCKVFIAEREILLQKREARSAMKCKCVSGEWGHPSLNANGRTATVTGSCPGVIILCECDTGQSGNSRGLYIFGPAEQLRCKESFSEIV